MNDIISLGPADDGIWSPVIYSGATVLCRRQTVQIPFRLDFWSVVLG